MLNWRLDNRKSPQDRAGFNSNNDKKAKIQAPINLIPQNSFCSPGLFPSGISSVLDTGIKLNISYKVFTSPLPNGNFQIPRKRMLILKPYTEINPLFSKCNQRTQF